MNILIISLITIMYVIDLALTLVNHHHSKGPIPANARDIYDQEKYAQWLNYSLETTRHGVIVKTVMTALLLALLAFGFFGFLEAWTNTWFAHPLLQTLAFLGVFMLFSILISLPFNYYETFVIEEKFGFNTTTHKTFILDMLKSILLTAVLGGGIIALLHELYFTFGSVILNQE
jgi:STE24 endopeptidase